MKTANRDSGRGRITVECRKSDGACIASEVYASYPVRLHLTSSPNQEVSSRLKMNRTKAVVAAAGETGQSGNDGDDMNSHRSPPLQKALTCYVLGYGGGLISGDSIHLQLHVKTNASVVMTSQSTTKAFRAVPGRPETCVVTRATVQCGSLLVLVPQPTQCFRDSRSGQRTHVRMEHGTVVSGGMKKTEGGGEGLFRNGCPMNASEVCQDSMTAFSSSSYKEPSLLLVDWYTGGRANLDGGLWKFDTFRSTTTISYGTVGGDNESSERPVFRDATRLSGGGGADDSLRRHMRDFNVVCMVILLGPRVKVASDLFLKKFSSRNSYYQEGDVVEEEVDVVTKDANVGCNDSFHMQRGTNAKHHQNGVASQNRGEGLNTDGLLVSCGTFDTVKGCPKGVIVRLASRTVEQAATFLSKYIGTLDGQLESDPFWEILVLRQGSTAGRLNNRSLNSSTGSRTTSEEYNLSFDLMRNSFTEETLSDPPESSSDEQYSPVSEIQTTSADGRKKGIVETTKRQFHVVKPIVLYQLVDSATPTGGFAHSNTLEAAYQLHLIGTRKDVHTASLLQHSWDVLLQTMTSIVPFLVSACRLLRSARDSLLCDNSDSMLPPAKEMLDEWNRLDMSLSATITSHVSSRASSVQGSGLLRAFTRIFAQIAPVLRAIKKRVMRESVNQECRGHAATCFGAVCGLLDVDDQTCTSTFLYITARDMINAAVRMNLVGPLEGGRFTNELCTRLDSYVEEKFSDASDTVDERQGVHPNEVTLEKSSEGFGVEWITPEDAHQVAPLVEILANAHDRLYTRLFNS